MAKQRSERTLDRSCERCASRYPETSETPSWGHPNFKAGKKMFVAFEQIKGRPSIAFRLEPKEVERLLMRKQFFETPYGRGQWVSLWADGPLEWQAVHGSRRSQLSRRRAEANADRARCQAGLKARLCETPCSGGSSDPPFSSIRAQCLHRRDSRPPTRWHVAGHHGDGSEHHGRHDERGGIERLDLVEEHGQQSGQRCGKDEPGDDADADQSQRLRKDEVEYGPRCRAQCHAHANLLRPLSDGIRHHAVHADGGQQERHHREGYQQHCHGARARERRVHDFLHGAHVGERQLAVECVHRRANTGASDRGFISVRTTSVISGIASWVCGR